MSRKIGLALGSGAARGLSHIGVLRWLREQDVEISCIAGTSIGSIIGALAAAGYTPEQMEEIALSIKWTDLVRYLRFSFGGSSIFEWKRIEEFLREQLGDRTIKDLDIPFACVSTDIDSGEEIVFHEGDLVSAISASSAIAGVFPPVRYEDRLLLDGELVNPVPLDVACDLGADMVIGVNVCRPLYMKRVSHGEEHRSFVAKLDDWVKTGLEKAPKRVADLYDKLPLPGKHDSGTSRPRMLYDVVADSISILSSKIFAVKRLEAGPHFIIEPRVGWYRSFDFDNAGEIINLGYLEIDSLRDEFYDFLNLW